MIHQRILVLSVVCLALAGCDEPSDVSGRGVGAADSASAALALPAPADVTTIAAQRPRVANLYANPSKLADESFDFEASLRGAGKTLIHANVYTFGGDSKGRTVLAIHGLNETARVFEPVVDLASGNVLVRSQLARIVAINLPGHGESAFPEGVSFGQLTIDDNVSVVHQALDELRARGVRVDAIAGHSMGGLTVAALQQTLLSEGSSLKDYGVEYAVLLAPVPPHGRPWTQPPPSDLSQFTVQDPQRGAYVKLSDEMWVAQAFTTTKGELVKNAPTPQKVADRGYNGIEPLTTLHQLFETPIAQSEGDPIVMPRPSVEANIFAKEHGTRLASLCFSEDALVPAADVIDLHKYLSGRAEDDVALFDIKADDAVHSMFISNPSRALELVIAQLL